MKESCNKKQKKKAIPHCFQKKSSNTSLSQILYVGTYKKRIRDLARNNRRLALELNVSRLENARLNSQLKDCNKTNHQITLARLKLKHMANTIAKLVTDMDEVNSYLDGNWETNLQDKVSHEKLKIKFPAVSSIEELSPANETPIRETCTEIITTSDQESSEINNENQISSELPPILFVEDSEENNKEKSTTSSRKSSRRSNVADQESLTPKLDVDLSIFNRRRTSSRRQTQKFVFQEQRHTRSKGKTLSSGREIVSDQSSPSVIPNEQGFAEIIEIQNDEASEQTSHKNAKITTSVHSQRIDPNHTLLLCEDMDLTDVVHPCIPIAIGNSLPSVDIIPTFHNTGVKSNVPKRNEVIDFEEKSMLVNPLQNNDSYLQKTAVCYSGVESANISSSEHGENYSPGDSRPALSDLLSPSPHQSTYQQKIDFLCEKNSNNDNKKKEQLLNDLESPFPIKLCRLKSLNCRNVLFSDESDQDSTPVKKQMARETKGKNNETLAGSSKIAAYNPTYNLNKTPSEHENKKRNIDFSVYDLDISNSEIKKSQKSKIKKSKKPTQKKDLPKLVLQNCRVTKLKSGNYKFSKHELTDKLTKVNDLLKPKPTLEISPSSDALNASLSDIDEKGNQSTSIRKSILSTNKCIDNSSIGQQGTPKSEAKRVSFAATDIVCSYKKMSVSKVISENEKVRCVSKCVKETENMATIKNIGFGIATEGTVNKKVDIGEVLNSSDETELYIPPINVCAVVATNNNNALLQKKCVTVKYSNKQGRNLKNNEVKDASKSQTKEVSHIKDALHVESLTAAEITSLKAVDMTESLHSDETEIYTFPLSAHIIAESNLHPSLKYNVSSVNEELETVQIYDKDNPDDKSSQVIMKTSKKQKNVSDRNVKHLLKSDKTQEKINQKETLELDTTIEIVTQKKVAPKRLLNLDETKLDKLCVDTEAMSHHPFSQSPLPLAAEHSTCEENNNEGNLTCKLNHLNKKNKKKQENFLENNSIKNTSKFSDEAEKPSKPNNILCNETVVATGNATNKKLCTKKLFDSSEFHRFQLNSLVATETGDLHPSSQSTISSATLAPESEHCKENLVFKSDHLTRKTKKNPGKLSLKINKMYQKGFPDKSVDKRDSQSVNITQVRDKFSCDSTKENEICSDLEPLDIPQKLKCKSKLSEVALGVLPANEGKTALDTINKRIKSSSKASANKNNRSSKHVAIQDSPNTLLNKEMKNNVPFSPVLKDVVNLEANAENILPKRRSRTNISYKEPSLSKKMRRD